MAMRRPALFLWCRVKTDSLRRPITVPIPLSLVEDLLLAVVRLLRFGGKWVSWQQMGEYGEVMQQVLQELPRFLQELRTAGPFTLVEVYDPKEGTEVVLRLV